MSKNCVANRRKRKKRKTKLVIVHLRRFVRSNNESSFRLTEQGLHRNSQGRDQPRRSTFDSHELSLPKTQEFNEMRQFQGMIQQLKTIFLIIDGARKGWLFTSWKSLPEANCGTISVHTFWPILDWTARCHRFDFSSIHCSREQQF